jgi:hypothetical protein
LELVRYRKGFCGHWRPGFVQEIQRHKNTIVIQDGKDPARTCAIQLGGKGRQGQIKRVWGPALVELMDEIKVATRRAQLQVDPDFVPPLRVVRTGGTSRPVFIPAPPARCPSYLEEVRRDPCINCDKPPPSDPHHDGPRGVRETASDFLAVSVCRRCHRAVTDSKPFPGRSIEETKLMILQAQVTRMERRCAAALQREEADRYVQALRDWEHVQEIDRVIDQGNYFVTPEGLRTLTELSGLPERALTADQRVWVLVMRQCVMRGLFSTEVARA